KRHLEYSDGELRRRTVLSTGTLIADRYQLEVPLGRGGMDEVRRATSERDDKLPRSRVAHLGARSKTSGMRKLSRSLAW
ncbi:hypothetical protein ACWFRK_39990, partial [Streptomyces sp. NPDC055157]